MFGVEVFGNGFGGRFPPLGLRGGKNPVAVSSCYLVVGGLLAAGWYNALLNTQEHTQVLWAYARGPIHNELDMSRYLHKQSPWLVMSSLAFYVAKSYGQDVATSRHMDELLESYKGFINSTGYAWSEREKPMRTI